MNGPIALAHLASRTAVRSVFIAWTRLSSRMLDDSAMSKRRVNPASKVVREEGRIVVNSPTRS